MIQNQQVPWFDPSPFCLSGDTLVLTLSLRVAPLAISLLMAAVYCLRPSPLVEQTATDDRLFELRIYTANDGKLEALNDRFRNHTNKLFEKHGMELIGYWTPSEGEGVDNTLVYMLAYPNKEAREASWSAFLNDPDWKKAFAESRKDGALVKKVENRFLSPTDYSPLK